MAIMAQSLVFTLKDSFWHSGHTTFVFKSQSSILSVPAWLELLQTPPAQQKLLSAPLQLETNWSCGFFPIRMEHKEPLKIPPHPVHNKPVFQAVTTCEAFPQVEHMDLIKCRSLTILSCSNSLNCLHINPWLHHFITASQPLTTFELSYLDSFSICLQYNKCAQACRCGLNQSLSQTHSDTLLKAFSPDCKRRDGLESPGKGGESAGTFVSIYQ